MFNLNMQGLDDEWFTNGMQNLVLGTAPSTTFGLLVAILAPYEGKCIHEVTTAMAALRDIEGRHREGRDISVHVVMPRPLRTKKKKKGPIQGPV